MEINNQIQRKWFDRGYAHLLIYAEKHPELDISEKYQAPDGFELGQWISEIRKQWNEGELESEYVKKLMEIGLAKDRGQQAWESMYRQTDIYIADHKGNKPKVSEQNEDGIMVGAWLDRQIRIYSRLSEEQKNKLKKISRMAENERDTLMTEAEIGDKVKKDTL